MSSGENAISAIIDAVDSGATLQETMDAIRKGSKLD
jgi:hypothetical protein